MSQYFPKLFRSFAENISVIVDLSNYATKTDPKNITHIDTSSFALKTNLASLKTKVDKLDIDTLLPVPVDLSKLSDVVKNDVVKKAVYDNLAAKVNNIDTSDFVQKLNMKQTKQSQKRIFLMELILLRKQNSLNQKKNSRCQQFSNKDCVNRS